jgi:predicted HD phosphohydrolase
MDHVKFTQMKDGDREDYAFLTQQEAACVGQLGARLLESLEALKEGFSGFQIDRLGHSVQSATRAWRDGADLDWIVAALLHDIGDLHAPYNHDEYAALILRPFVREQCTWVVQVHADFQKYYYADKIGGNANVRDRYRDNPYFQDCVDFCELWDQASFDPGYKDLPLDFFRPMVLEVFARKPYDPAVIRAGERVPLCDPALAAARANE